MASKQILTLSLCLLQPQISVFGPTGGTRRGLCCCRPNISKLGVLGCFSSHHSWRGYLSYCTIMFFLPWSLNNKVVSFHPQNHWMLFCFCFSHLSRVSEILEPIIIKSLMYFFKWFNYWMHVFYWPNCPVAPSLQAFEYTQTFCVSKQTYQILTF